MMAVVICLSGGRGANAQRFLEGNPGRAVVALGPGNILITIRDIEAKGYKPTRVVTDSLRCLEVVSDSSTYGREVVFCGDDPEQAARRKPNVVCLSSEASFIEIKEALQSLDSGRPSRRSDGGGPSRLRRE